MCLPVGRLRSFLSLVETPVMESDQLHPDQVMDTMESDRVHTPIVIQIARVALVAVMITIAVWLVTNYVLDSLGHIFLK